jgi:murein L,D-transpeptidase YafK
MSKDSSNASDRPHGPQSTPTPESSPDRSASGPGLRSSADLRRCGPAPATGFKDQQLKHARVRAAAAEKEGAIRELFGRQNLCYPPRRIFLRVFKKERTLELWAGQKDGSYARLKEYAICASSGSLGPKRREGDGQVPEGFYVISAFNPRSNFHLSLRVNYPNESDSILGAQGRLGGDIYIHGDCVTIGCVPLTDEGIKELYVIAVEARSAGQQEIPVHIFPARMDAAGMRALERDYAGNQTLWDFWLNLKEGFDIFEKHRKLPGVRVNANGRYIFTESSDGR